MNLRSRNKVQATFNMSSMTDLIFLLLIFFMLTSTLVSPNVLKLFLPSSSSKTFAKQTVSVSITKEAEYFIDREAVSIDELPSRLAGLSAERDETTIVLNADKDVALDHVVKVMDIANNLNLKMVLATSPK